MDGGAGNDTIYSTSYEADIISGGTGNDSIEGIVGTKTYLFNRGDGQDTIVTGKIYSGRGPDISDSTIKFGEGISRNDLIVTAENDDLIISISDTADSIRISNFLASSWYYGSAYLPFRASVGLADGTAISSDELLTMLSPIMGTENNDIIEGSNADDFIYGKSGDDVINGKYGNDTIYGNDGNDTIDGDEGNDTYIYNTGDGFDYITDFNGVDTIKFGTGITVDNIRFNQEPNNLSIWFDGIENSGITIENFFSNPDNKIENFEFADGTVISDISSRIYAVVTEESHTLAEGIHDLVLRGNANINGTGNNSDNYIEGNSGNNILSGAGGNDFYSFNPSFGQDAVMDSEGNNQININSELSASSYTLNLNGNNLEILELDSTNKITIQDWALSDSNKNFSILLNGQEIYNREGIEAVVNSAQRSSISDTEINSLIQEMSVYAPEAEIIASSQFSNQDNQILLAMGTGL